VQSTEDKRPAGSQSQAVPLVTAVARGSHSDGRCNPNSTFAMVLETSPRYRPTQEHLAGPSRSHALFTNVVCTRQRTHFHCHNKCTMTKDPPALAPALSLLFVDLESRRGVYKREAVDCCIDLNLDQLVGTVTSGRDEYNLRPFFYTPLNNVAAIQYRYDVFRALENPTLAEQIGTFARTMRTVRAQQEQKDKHHYRLQKQRLFVEAVATYTDAVRSLTGGLTSIHIESAGLKAFREYLIAYVHSAEFAARCAETQSLESALSQIRYCIHIEGNRIRVSRYAAEGDYGEEVLRTFEKFKQGTGKTYSFDFRGSFDINHIEAAVLERVAWLHPDIFLSLANYCDRHCDFLDETIRVFDREIQFYVAWLEHIEHLKGVGLPFCYPDISDKSTEVYGHDVFDLALSSVLIRDKSQVVKNDFYLKAPERILVISGPNQGGKTTFARTFGQLHYLASLGCLVPARSARLFVCDRLFTHFERQEDLQDLSSKLENDLRRIHAILQEATSNSILIMNESLSATTLQDALFLGTKILRLISERGLLCVYVTFLDELALLNEVTVSMVSTVDPENPLVRTFKVVRKPPDGLAYAMAIARKYRLTYACLKERINS
jgi:DNA mismatch repair protein MutS